MSDLYRTILADAEAGVSGYGTNWTRGLGRAWQECFTQRPGRRSRKPLSPCFWMNWQTMSILASLTSKPPERSWPLNQPTSDPFTRSFTEPRISYSLQICNDASYYKN